MSERGAWPDQEQGLYLWRGFHHQWLGQRPWPARPHRLGALHSFIDQERHALDQAGRWRPSACFVMGQRPGADEAPGQRMRPLGFYSALHLPGLRVERAVVRLDWTDSACGQPYPRAMSERELVAPLPALGDMLDSPHGAVVLLRGLELSLRADPDKQPPRRPGGGDGMWPILLACRVERWGAGQAVVRVSLGRAWTPLRGGLPPLRVTPMTERLDVALAVHLTALACPDPQALHVTLADPWQVQSRGRLGCPAHHRGVIQGRPGFAQATCALRGFGLALGLSAHQQGHQGRALRDLGLGLWDDGYSPQTGLMTARMMGHLGWPGPQPDATTRAWVEPALLQLGPKAQLMAERRVQGQLWSDLANAWSGPWSGPWFGRRSTDRASTQALAMDRRVL